MREGPLRRGQELAGGPLHRLGVWSCGSACASFYPVLLPSVPCEPPSRTPKEGHRRWLSAQSNGMCLTSRPPCPHAREHLSSAAATATQTALSRARNAKGVTQHALLSTAPVFPAGQMAVQNQKHFSFLICTPTHGADPNRHL